MCTAPRRTHRTWGGRRQLLPCGHCSAGPVRQAAGVELSLPLPASPVPIPAGHILPIFLRGDYISTNILTLEDTFYHYSSHLREVVMVYLRHTVLNCKNVTETLPTEQVKC